MGASRFGSLIAVCVTLLCAACSSTPQELVAKHTKRGDEYAKDKKFKEAVIEYKNAVKAGPDDASLHWKLAKAALESKDLRTAFLELEKSVELDPANFDAKGMLGEFYIAAGKNAEAAQIADNLVKSRPQDPQGYVLKSGIAAREGKVDEAIAQMKKAAVIDPKKSKLMIALGNLYMLKRDRKGASEWYDKALASDPNAPEVHVSRGNFFFAFGEKEEGEKEYRKAIELSTEKEILRIALAEHLLYQGMLEDSEKELNAVIRELNSQKARKVLAEIKLETGKAPEAKPIVDSILKENEKDLDGKYLKARIALAERRLDDAKTLFGEVVRQDAVMAQARLYNGVTEILQGNIEIGKKEVMEAVKLDPGNVRAHLVLGDVYLKSGAPDAAEKEALEVLKRSPSNLQAAVLYGDSFLPRKEWTKAEQVYQAIVTQMPKSPLGYFKMGLSKKLQGRPLEAAGYFSRAVERNPRDLSAVNEYVFALAASKQTVKAQKVIDDYLLKEPRNARLWEMDGRFKLGARRTAEAESALLKAIELAPDDTQPYYELGMIYAAQKKLSEAEAKFTKVVQKDDRNVGAHTLLGVVQNSLGKIEEANRHYRRALEVAPKNPLAANNLASNLADYGGNLDEALKFAQVAREAAPEEPSIADTLGWIYYKKGLYDSAYPLLSDASRKLPKNAAVRYHYGMVLSKKGQTKESKVELNAALSLSSNFPGAGEAQKTLASIK